MASQLPFTARRMARAELAADVVILVQNFFEELRQVVPDN